MDFKLLFAVFLISCVTLTSAYYNYKEEGDRFRKISSDNDYYSSDEDDDPYDDNNSDDDDDGDNENDNESNENDDKRLIKDDNLSTQTESSAPTYEVTEIVDDIPNTNTVRGPIITNFTIPPPLNTASYSPNNTNNNNNNDNTRPNSRKGSINIFHINAEFDDDKPQVNIIQNNRPNFPNFNNIKDYIYGVKQGIASGISNIVNKNKVPPSTDVNGGVNGPYVPNIVSAPVIFLNKLQRRSSDVAAKVHEAIFGNKFGN